MDGLEIVIKLQSFLLFLNPTAYFFFLIQSLWNNMGGNLIYASNRTRCRVTIFVIEKHIKTFIIEKHSWLWNQDTFLSTRDSGITINVSLSVCKILVNCLAFSDTINHSCFIDIPCKLLECTIVANLVPPLKRLTINRREKS